MQNENEPGQVVPEEELRDLIDEWNKLAESAGPHQEDSYNARCETYATCAGELEELIQNGR